MSRLPFEIEHHPGPRGRRAVRRCFDYLLALLEFLAAPAPDLNLTRESNERT